MMATDLYFWGRMCGVPGVFRARDGLLALRPREAQGAGDAALGQPADNGLAHTSIVYSLLGQPELARQRAREAQELAQRIGHPHTMAYVLIYSAVGSQTRPGSPPRPGVANQAIAIATEQGYWLWGAWANIIRLWALSELGPSQELLEDLKRSIEEWRGRGVRAGMPPHCAALAGLHLKLGQVLPGLVAAQQGLRGRR